MIYKLNSKHTWKEEYREFGLGLSAAGRLRRIGSNSEMLSKPSTKGKHKRKWQNSENSKLLFFQMNIFQFG